MGLTALQYRDQLTALLPQGFAWSTDTASDLIKLLHGMADELARLDARSDVLLDEVDPRTTLECLASWERVAGLPDPCTGQPDTIQQRRNALVSRLTENGGASPQFFINLATSLGYIVTITEFGPWRVGQDAVNEPIYTEAWAYTWRVNAPAQTVIDWTVGKSAVNEPLRSFGNLLLECVISRLKPAHTNVLYAYG